MHDRQRIPALRVWRTCESFCRIASIQYVECLSRYSLVRSAARTSGLPRRRLHDAGHTHASLLMDQRANIKVVQARPGHADMRTTLQTYGHLMPDAHRREADRLEAVLAGDDVAKPAAP